MFNTNIKTEWGEIVKFRGTLEELILKLKILKWKVGRLTGKGEM